MRRGSRGAMGLSIGHGTSASDDERIKVMIVPLNFLLITLISMKKDRFKNFDRIFFLMITLQFQVPAK
jgi:hypothetical protein